MSKISIYVIIICDKIILLKIDLNIWRHSLDNMKKLIIAEKPSLAMEIVKAIGKMNKRNGYYENDQYIVSFAFGHLLVLQDIDDYFEREKTRWTLSELPFIPKKFKFKIRDDAGVQKQYALLEELINNPDVDTVVNCGDADREGEVIINNIIYRVFHTKNIKKDVKRLWLKSINQEEIKSALEKIKDIKETDSLYKEGLARTYLDWLYGINLTRYITLKAGDLLPVGRVLTPIVKRVYDRRLEIENFIPENYVEIDCKVKKDGEEIKTTVKNSKFKDADDNETVKAVIESLNKADSIVSDKQVKAVEKKPKKLFSLTTLQNQMVKVNKITLEDTLKAAQGLYEKGFITYPRTNTEYLHSSEADDIKKLVEKYANEGYEIKFKNTKSLFDDSKVESHSALMPTVKKVNFNALNHNEQLVYNAIFNRFLANFIIEKTIVEETKVTIKTSLDSRDYIIELKGNSIKKEGFYKYEKPDSKEKLLPQFSIGEIVDTQFFDAEKETSPPKLLTLVELNNYLKNPFKEERKSSRAEVQAEIDQSNDESDESSEADEKEYAQMLKGIEIGTVATRDNIISNAVKYGYITDKKTVLDITEKGKYLVEALEQLNIDMSKEKTVETSIILKEIYRKETTVGEALAKTASYFKTVIGQQTRLKRIDKRAYEGSGGKEKTRDIIGVCPKCGENIYESQKSFYCDGFRNEPKCTFSLWKEDKFFTSKGMSITAPMAKCLIEGKVIALRKLKSKDGSEYGVLVKIREPIGQYVNYDMRLEK